MDRRCAEKAGPGNTATMNSTREEALFALALEKPADKRPAFLDAMCDGDDESSEHRQGARCGDDQVRSTPPSLSTADDARWPLRLFRLASRAVVATSPPTGTSISTARLSATLLSTLSQMRQRPRQDPKSHESFRPPFPNLLPKFLAARA